MTKKPILLSAMLLLPLVSLTSCSDPALELGEEITEEELATVVDGYDEDYRPDSYHVVMESISNNVAVNNPDTSSEQRMTQDIKVIHEVDLELREEGNYYLYDHSRTETTETDAEGNSETTVTYTREWTTVENGEYTLHYEDEERTSTTDLTEANLLLNADLTIDSWRLTPDSLDDALATFVEPTIHMNDLGYVTIEGEYDATATLEALGDAINGLETNKVNAKMRISPEGMVLETSYSAPFTISFDMVVSLVNINMHYEMTANSSVTGALDGTIERYSA